MIIKKRAKILKRQIREAPQFRRRLQPYTWEESKSLPKRAPLIKGIVNRHCLSAMVGDPGTAKTFHAVDMGLHIALGLPWRGRKTHQGNVLYLAAEGGLGMPERQLAFELHHALTENPPFHLLPVCVDFCSTKKDAEEVIKEVHQMKGAELIIVDTMSQVLAGGDENSAQGIGAVLQNCKLIQQQTGAHVMVIHHTGKNGIYRGWSGIKGNIDTMIKVKEKDDVFVFESDKQRDGKKDDDIYSVLKYIDLGTDDEGESITSCVLIPTDKKPAKEKELSDQEQAGLDILLELVDEKGKERSFGTRLDGGKHSYMSVPRSDFHEALKTANITKSNKGGTIKKAITRIEKTLRDNKTISIHSDYIFMMGQKGQ